VTDYIFRQFYTSFVEVKVKGLNQDDAEHKGKLAVANMPPDMFLKQLANNRLRTETLTKEVIDG
jgi:hypothetical protein